MLSSLQPKAAFLCVKNKNHIASKYAQAFFDTYPNAITGYGLTAYAIPVVMDNDKEAMQAAVASSIGIDYQNPRIIMIDNSLEIEHILISEAMIPEAEKIPELVMHGEPFELEFDEGGNLLTPIKW